MWHIYVVIILYKKVRCCAFSELSIDCLERTPCFLHFVKTNQTNHTNKRDRLQVGSADLPRSPLSYGNMERTFSYAGRIPAFMMLRMRPLLESQENRIALSGHITENFFNEHAELVRAVPVLPDQLFRPARCCADVSSWCLVLRRQM